MTHEKENRLSVRFAGERPANSTTTYEHDVEQDATVESMRVRFYPGPQHELDIAPYVKRADGRFPLVEFAGDAEVLRGDDDVIELDIAESVYDEDTIGVEVTNNDPDWPYHWSVDVHLDRAGGGSRVVSWLRALIPGAGS